MALVPLLPQAQHGLVTHHALFDAVPVRGQVLVAVDVVDLQAD